MSNEGQIQKWSEQNKQKTPNNILEHIMIQKIYFNFFVGSRFICPQNKGLRNLYLFKKSNAILS